jgi:hypothetical protein
VGLAVMNHAKAEGRLFCLLNLRETRHVPLLSTPSYKREKSLKAVPFFAMTDQT